MQCCASTVRIRWDLAEGELSVEAKAFKTNPNARDLRGWSPACIAMFHGARKVSKAKRS
jgi:hypothetical protein